MTNRLDEIIKQYYWHQRWEVEPGVFTPGINDVQFLLDQVQFPKRLDGKRILEIGSWNGCFSLECERRGAAEVLGIGPEPDWNTGFAALREYLGSKVVRYQFGSIYDLDPAILGTFDIVLCFGVFYHLRYPMLGVDNIRRISRGELYLETACIDYDLTVQTHSGLGGIELASLHPSLRDIALLQFLEKDALNKDYSNWFSPNLLCMQQILQSAGFLINSAKVSGSRAYLSARVRDGYPDFLIDQTGENVYYDLFIKHLFGARESWEIKKIG